MLFYCQCSSFFLLSRRQLGQFTTPPGLMSTVNFFFISLSAFLGRNVRLTCLLSIVNRQFLPGFAPLPFVTALLVYHRQIFLSSSFSTKFCLIFRCFFHPPKEDNSDSLACISDNVNSIFIKILHKKRAALPLYRIFG
jgi:hypothetical protein